MNIAIIGGGFTGLTAAYELSKKGHEVTIFERDSQLGGLAVGWKEPSWNWHLERAYHHLFTNDHAILSLLKRLGLKKKIIVKRPVTATLWRDHMYALDSVSSLFQFPGLTFIDKIHTASLLGFLKLTPLWQPLEFMTAKTIIRLIGGNRAWKTIWEPLMVGKFSQYADTIAASWFWARIKKRTPKLCYIEGGFQTLVHALETAIKNQDGKIITGAMVLSITHQISNNKKSLILNTKTQSLSFDKVLLTIPTPLAVKLVPALTEELSNALTIPHLHAHVLVLETKKPILKKIYWLNVTDKSFPFLIVGAHTNFMDAKHYGNRHITYIGNYLPTGHPYLSMTKEQILKKYLPFILRLSPTMNHEPRTTNSYMFVAPFAQPVHEKRYSSRAPKLTTSIPGLFLANMDSIYPWDRGTNYAVELGIKAARTIQNV
jgi:protoporphyrinogen oxidase